MVFAGGEGDVLGTIGVFLSGAGSILTALGAIHYERRRGEKVCKEKFDAFNQGIRMRETLAEPKKEDTHVE